MEELSNTHPAVVSVSSNIIHASVCSHVPLAFITTNLRVSALLIMEEEFFQEMYVSALLIMEDEIIFNEMYSKHFTLHNTLDYSFIF